METHYFIGISCDFPSFRIRDDWDEESKESDDGDADIDVEEGSKKSKVAPYTSAKSPFNILGLSSPRLYEFPK